MPRRQRLTTYNRNSRRRHDNVVEELLTAQRRLYGQHFFVARTFLVEEAIEEYSVGSLSEECQHCSALHFTVERSRNTSYTNCCHHGKVELPSTCVMQNGNEELRLLFTSRDRASVNFRNHIRQYNSALSFASMKAKVVPFRTNGPYVYKIHGSIYHQVSQLHPVNGTDRRYGQLYMIDTAEATETRVSLRQNDGCEREVFQKLSNILMENNPYARMLKTMAATEQRMIRNNENVANLRIKFLKHNTRNQPSANEIAGIFVGQDGALQGDVDFVIYPNTGGQQFLKITSPHLDPLCYPLFFLFGEQGWCETMFHNENFATRTRRKITLLEFYSYRLAIRRGFSIIHYGGKLTQQYIVDAYFKIEMNRLNFLRFNQNKLRSEIYQGIVDSLANGNNNMPIGRMVLLPPSFSNAPRNMQQNYQDAMAIVRKFGKPDLFITFTCNPKWKDITESINNWETVESRPDLVARVFNLKLKELLDDLTVKNVLGKVVAYIYVIEFQKRSLPHAHILLNLRNEDKFLSKELIDATVCAEIPNIETHPILHNIVTRHMLHGPCGFDFPNAPCMQNGVCTKCFPKSFSNETIESVDGYPVYQRRNNGTTFVKNVNGRSCTFDNRYVVPYNPYLTIKYNAHVNTEICASIKSVKYLYKYVYKGHDSAQLEVSENDNDEIKHYMECRYISPPEAMWRIYEHKLHARSHTVVRLAVHLPFEQIVYFTESRVNRAINDAKDTTLLAWFKLNQVDINARQYLYCEIPNHYTFQASHTWSTRQRGGDSVISRMYMVSITEQERYFLRLLLLHVKGATSFEDIRTVDGELLSSFKEACERRNLLDTDNEIVLTLDEAATFAMPKHLRFLFATVCMFCAPRNIMELWNRFVHLMIEDYTREHDIPTSHRLALIDINETLTLHNVRITDLGLPDPGGVFVEPIIAVDEERRIGMQYYSSLNNEQKLIVDKVLESVRNRQGGLYFIDGPGGTGKTHVYKTLIHILRGESETVIPVAFTGIAATLLPGGRTSHSRFKLPVPLLDNSTSSIRPNSRDAEFLRVSSTIIWDEAPMAPKYALKVLDLLLKDIMQSTFPFGGKVLLLGGDFRQVLPVVPRASTAAILECSIKYSEYWQLFHQLHLTINMRAQNDNRFTDWLLQLGNGTLPSLHLPCEDTIEIPNEVLSNNVVNDIYGEYLHANQMDEYANSAILCPKNDECFYINELVLNKLSGEIFEYSSFDDVECENETERRNFPTEFLNSLTPSGMPPHKLKLKIGAIIMLLRNINPKRGLCNGTRLVVSNCRRHCIEAIILTGEFRNEKVIIPRILLAPSDTNLPFTLKRKQFPIRLSFAMTINKSQGQTFSRIGLYLKDTVFAHGQLYVAFSRVQSFENIKVQIVNGEKQGHNDNVAYTSNVVSKQIL